MKVLYDDQVFATQRYGGISRYITEIATRTAQHAEVRVSAGMYLNRYLQEAQTKQTLNVSGFFADQDRAWRIRDRLNQIWTSWQSRSFQPDVVHETYYRRNALHQPKAKVVVTVHDFIHEKYPNEVPHSNFHADLKSASLVRADAIICISNATKRDLLQYYPKMDASKIRVIHHGHSFRAPGDFARKKVRDITSSRPFILHVGHRQGYKRFADTVDAFANAKQSSQEMLLVAFGCGSFSRQEIQEMKSRGLAETDFLYLEGPDEVLNACYMEAAAFCYPSKYEGFGIPILESMSAGCPVICSDIEVFHEVAQGHAEYFQNVEHLTHLFTKYLSTRRKTTLPANTDTWETSAAEHLRLYNEVL